MRYMKTPWRGHISVWSRREPEHSRKTAVREVLTQQKIPDALNNNPHWAKCVRHENYIFRVLIRCDSVGNTSLKLPLYIIVNLPGMLPYDIQFQNGKQ